MFQQFFLERGPAGIRYQQSQIRSFEYSAAFFCPESSQFARVVIQSGGVYQQNRTERQHFHGFLNGISSRTGLVGDNGDRLSGERVEQR